MEEASKMLEEMRTEMEMLKVEHKAKCLLSESLKKALDEQLIKLQNTRMENEKQAKEIDAKAEEIAVEKLKYGDLLSMFHEKELVLKQLSSASESTRIGLKEKIKELEKLNMDLVTSLDEANIKVEKQEIMVCTYRKEIRALEELLSVSQKKYSDAELRAQAPKEVKRRDEMLDELVREKEEIENKLKWKSEQFRHLEEAFNKVQCEFRASKEECASERSNFLNVISSSQSSLDYLKEVVKDLRSQLQICNQALAYEESRRRLLEIQISESKEMYENVVLEYEEVKSNIAALTARRDEEIASIRNSMSEKNMFIKELEYKNTFLKQENEELLEQFKRAQEAQINIREDSSSLKSLRQKFRALELTHKACSDKQKAAEIDWNQQMERVTEELNGCLLKLNSKDEEIGALVEELEFNHCLVIQTRMENEELSIIHMILQCKLSEIRSDLKDYDLEVKSSNEKAEEIAFLNKQSENKSLALNQAVEEVFQRASHALEKANSSLSEKISAFDDVKFELRQQKNVMRQLKRSKCDLEIKLKGNHSEIQELKTTMETAILEKIEMEKALMEVKENLFQTLEEQRAALILNKQELEYKSLLIVELEKTIVSLMVKLESEEKLSSNLANSVQHLQAKSSTEKFHFIEQMMGLETLIGNVSNEGEELRKKWDRILLKSSCGVDIVEGMERKES